MNIKQRLIKLETSTPFKKEFSKPAPTLTPEQWMFAFGGDKDIIHEPFTQEQQEWVNTYGGLDEY
jgi:hypothetical protein